MSLSTGPVLPRSEAILSPLNIKSPTIKTQKKKKNLVFQINHFQKNQTLPSNSIENPKNNRNPHSQPTQLDHQDHSLAESPAQSGPKLTEILSLQSNFNLKLITINGVNT
jgi:hypothetical protein